MSLKVGLKVGFLVAGNVVGLAVGFNAGLLAVGFVLRGLANDGLVLIGVFVVGLLDGALDGIAEEVVMGLGVGENLPVAV